MNELIASSYWLLFDYIKPCLNPVPRIEEHTPSWGISTGVCVPWYETGAEITFSAFHKSVNATNVDVECRPYEYQVMVEFLYGRYWHIHGQLETRVTDIFRSRKTHAEYEIFLIVLKNMILAGKITKDRCVKILTEAENHEALVELLQFDAGEEPGRFDI